MKHGVFRPFFARTPLHDPLASPVGKAKHPQNLYYQVVS